MSALRSALNEIRSEELAQVSDEALEEDLAELQRAADVLEAERMRRLAEVERRQSYRRDGYLSTVAWLRARFRMPAGEASEHVRTARALEEMDLARMAFAEGEVSSWAVRTLAGARRAHPEEFAGQEKTLVEAAASLPYQDLTTAIAYWRGALDHRRALEEAEDVRARRRLFATRTAFGMVRVDGDLDPESGETVLAALRAVQDADARSGPPLPRTPAQRRADALAEVCRQWLDRRDRPQVGGERPHVNVLIDLQALRGESGICEADHVSPIPPETARRLACDASVSRVITRGRSEPLDVGRRTLMVPAPIRRALVVRHRGCRFPGCDRPHPWCDAHHVKHWTDGGETKVPNLLLLCRPHHRMVHESWFRIVIEGGTTVFRRSDGTPLRPP